ncbi:MAG: hypothetical protein IJ493_13005 [Clostridia bacterium]|nr:hypothetical protein [Clostridia bacterium]
MNSAIKKSSAAPEFHVRPVYNRNPGVVLVNIPAPDALYSSTYTMFPFAISGLHYRLASASRARVNAVRLRASPGSKKAT